MYKFCFGLLCSVLICGLLVVPGMTQQQAERIEVGGVPLQIGMAQDTVVSQLTQNGLEVRKGENGSSWPVFKRNGPNYDVMGALAFTNSRLIWANRTLDDEDLGAAKLVCDFYFLMKSFEKQGNKSCTIETKEQESPDFDSKSVLIQCGKRIAKLS